MKQKAKGIVPTRRVSALAAIFGDVDGPDAIGDETSGAREASWGQLKTCIVLPNNPVKVVWDWFLIIFVLYSSFTVPIQICFTLPPSPTFDIIDYMVDAFFICDLLINFRTAYDAHDGTFVRDPIKIRRKYLSSWFTLDLFASIPFDRFGGDADSSLWFSMAKVRRT